TQKGKTFSPPPNSYATALMEGHVDIESSTVLLPDSYIRITDRDSKQNRGSGCSSIPIHSNRLETIAKNYALHKAHCDDNSPCLKNDLFLSLFSSLCCPSFCKYQLFTNILNFHPNITHWCSFFHDQSDLTLGSYAQPSSIDLAGK